MTARTVAHAMAYQRRKDTTPNGNALIALRREIAGEEPTVEDISAALDFMRRMLAVQPTDMPPATDDVSLLLDTLAFQIGAPSRAKAWQAIGVSKTRGRDLMARSAHALDFPTFHTLRSFAFTQPKEPTE